MPEPGSGPAPDIEREALGLLDDLLDVPETARTRWIAERTARPEVRARLAQLLETERLVSLRTGSAGVALAGVAPLPERIGNYRVTGLVGRGGMGAVYRATRDSGDFAHEVAIKLIKPGLLSDVLAERFRAERQTLAALRHPNIARLYDGGETADGSPYIVMELIEGMAVDRWADAQGLDARGRAALVETVAQAVAYAHGRLVVHRDITPLNVLVDGDGTPKLIDFGIARAADAQGASTAGDIAALGRLLARMVPAPDRELAAIIACAGSEQARYPSADALAADLRAWALGEPVSAVGGGERYRLRKFVARNRAAVAAAVVALLALAGGLVATSLANAEAQRARKLAEARFEETRGIANALLFGVYDAVSRVPGATLAREQLARTGLGYLDALAALPEAPTDVQLEAGRGLVRLASVTGGGQQASLGQHAEANALLARAEALLLPLYRAAPREQAVAEAFAALRLEQAHTNIYNNSKPAVAIAQAREAEVAIAPFARANAAAAGHYAAALVAQGDGWSWSDDYAKAQPMHLKAEAFMASLPADLQRAPEVLGSRGTNLRMLAESHHKLKQVEAARAANDAAVAASRELVAADPGDPARQRKLAQALRYAAIVHRTNYRDPQARAAIDEALAIARTLAARDPADAGGLRLLALVAEVKAQTLMDAGARTESLALTDELIAIHERLVVIGGDPPGAQRSLAAALRTSGGNRYAMGDIDGACRIWRRTLATYLGLERDGHLTDTDRSNGLPETRTFIADICEGGKPRSAWPKL
jgi:serine/threonine-protein kinase